MILYSSNAVSDIDRVRNFLEVRNPQAAIRALRSIRSALARIEATPYIGKPTKAPDIRQIVVRFGRYGYIVRYRVLPPDETIFVTRIWHGREARE
jgi:plasmid stabilization system protein ParE